jgi:hypothetical protein
MPNELGPSILDPFERCNLWLLYTALAYEPEKVRFVCLWNGGGGEKANRAGGLYGYEDILVSTSTDEKASAPAKVRQSIWMDIFGFDLSISVK